MTRNHLGTVDGIAPPSAALTPGRRAADRPRVLVYTEGGRVELVAVPADGVVLDPGAARLLAATLVKAVADLEADHRSAFGWDAVEEGAAFERSLDLEAGL